MEMVVHELQGLVAYYEQRFNIFTEEEISEIPAPGKWSKKEVIGHLVDSAQNNLRRFITAQYESKPPHIIYDQNFWVIANGYQQMPIQDVITLWKLTNLSICNVLTQMPEDNYGRLCYLGKNAEESHSIQWLAEDYVRHLKHHINQVIPDSFDIVYK